MISFSTTFNYMPVIMQNTYGQPAAAAAAQPAQPAQPALLMPQSLLEQMMAGIVNEHVVKRGFKEAFSESFHIAKQKKQEEDSLKRASNKRHEIVVKKRERTDAAARAHQALAARAAPAASPAAGQQIQLNPIQPNAAATPVHVEHPQPTAAPKTAAAAAGSGAALQLQPQPNPYASLYTPPANPYATLYTPPPPTTNAYAAVYVKRKAEDAAARTATQAGAASGLILSATQQKPTADATLAPAAAAAGAAAAEALMLDDSTAAAKGSSLAASSAAQRKPKPKQPHPEASGAAAAETLQMFGGSAVGSGSSTQVVRKIERDTFKLQRQGADCIRLLRSIFSRLASEYLEEGTRLLAQGQDYDTVASNMVKQMTSLAPNHTLRQMTRPELVEFLRYRAPAAAAHHYPDDSIQASAKK